MLKAQCPNPACGNPKLSVTTASVIAQPGEGGFSRLLARLPMADLPNVGQAVLSSAFVLLFVGVLVFVVTPPDSLLWLVVDIVAISFLSVLTLLFLATYVYMKRYPSAARLTMTNHKCKRCGYNWMSSDSPGETQIRRLEWELAECRKRGDKSCVAAMLSGIGGLMTMYRSDPRSALPLLEEALAMRTETRTKEAGYTLNNLAFTLLYLGETGKARRHAEEGLALLREQREWNGLASTLNTLGFILLQEGEVEQARAVFVESLQLKARMANPEYIAWDLEGLAAAAAEQGQAGRAALLLGKAGALREGAGRLLPGIARPRYERTLALIRGAMPEPELNQAWAEGWNMPVDYAISHALGEPAYPMAPTPVHYSVLNSR